MEQVIDTINKLVKEEFLSGENREQIQQVLIRFLLENPENNCETTLESLIDRLEDKNYDYDPNMIIIFVREATLDEQKLIDEGVIINAQLAKQMSDSCAKKIHAIKYSGLTMLKQDTMLKIRDYILHGNNSMVLDLDYSDYDCFLSLIEWLKNLGFRTERLKNMCYKINW